MRLDLPRPVLHLVLALGASVSCTKENPGFESEGNVAEGSGGSSGSGSSGAAATSGGSTGGSVGGSSGATTEALTSGPTTEPVTSSTGTTGAVESSGGSTLDPSSGSSSGGEVGLCDVVLPPPEAFVEVWKLGVPVGPQCGKTFDFQDVYLENGDGVVRFYDAGGCNKGGNKWELKSVGFTLGPVLEAPSCGRVRLEFSAQAPVCPLLGVGVIHEGVPIYVGGFSRLRGPEGLEGFVVEPAIECLFCEVDDVLCCDHALEEATYAPGRYTLAAPGHPAGIPEEDAGLGSVDGEDYLFRVLKARVSPECGPTPPEVWFGVRWWAELQP